MLQPEIQLNQLHNSNNPNTPAIFVHNISEVFGGVAVGRQVQKIEEIEARAAWLPEFAAVVVSKSPDQYFEAYMAEHYREPEFIVPSGLNRGKLTLADGFDDQELQRAVRGRRVEMYMGDRAWHEFVTTHGGEYRGGDPGNSVALANDKVEYIYGWGANIPAEAPPGDVTQGIDETVNALYNRLQAEGKAIVRLAIAGGGLGNTKVDKPMSKVKLRELLLRRHPGLDDPGVRALVETFLPNLVWSPSVTHDTERGHISDGLQTTIGTEYVGRISPTPPDVFDSEQLREISQKSAANLRAIGFSGYAGADLGVQQKLPTVKEVFRFEENGRTTAARHADAVARSFMGPEERWREDGYVYISRDEFFLRHSMTTPELLGALAHHGLLAKPGELDGAVVIIPPAGKIAGIQVHAQGKGAKGYRRAYETFQKVMDVVGDREANREDHPYIPE